MRTPAFGVAAIAPLILAGAVARRRRPARRFGSPRSHRWRPSNRHRASSGAAVVAVTKTPTPFNIAAANLRSPPSAVVNSPGTLRIPTMALNAYRNAER